MKKFEDFQKELIIDRQEVVSKFRTITEFSLNALGWFLWFTLIRPLVLLILWYISYRFFKYHMFTLEGIENPEFFGIGFGIAISIFLGMFIWHKYNLIRFGSLERRKSHKEATAEEMAKYYKIKVTEAEELRNAKVIEAYFDKEETVRLKTESGIQIEALYAPLNPAKHRSKG